MREIGEVHEIPITSTDNLHQIDWKIRNFSSFSNGNNTYYESPEFRFFDKTWRLVIYPNGLIPIDSAVRISLCRQYPFFYCPPIHLDYTLGLKRFDGKKDSEHHRAYAFGSFRSEPGLDAFIAISELEERKSDLLPDDVLTVFCSMKCHDAVENSSKACAAGTFPHEDKVLHDFKEFFLKGEDCDVTINVQGREFAAHKAILKARSPVFAAAFRHNTKENLPGPLEVKDCDPSCFPDFLNFLYCGDISVVSGENVFNLFTVADKYEILDLRSKCLELIKNILSVDTFCESISLALLHSDNELIKLCTQFFISNAPKIVVTLKWQTFLAKNPTTSNELLVKLLVPGDSSEA